MNSLPRVCLPDHSHLQTEILNDYNFRAEKFFVFDLGRMRGPGMLDAAWCLQLSVERITTLLYPEMLRTTTLFSYFHTDVTQEQGATADVAYGLLSIQMARLLCPFPGQRGV